MSEPGFDTLAASQKLQDSSFERQQAEGVIGVIVDAQQNLVTKDDLNQVEDRLTGKIDALGVRLDGDIKVLSGKVDAQGDSLKSDIGSLRTIMLGAFLPVMLAILAMMVVMLMGQE